MVEILKFIVAIINELHDLLTNVFPSFGTHSSDKELHFIVIGIVGMFIYIVVDKLFKIMSKYSISILSFIYTFTVLIVIVFAIEIMQKITKSGNMEFLDIVAGLWGFIAFFFVYTVLYNLIRYITKIIKKHNHKRTENI
ncbi:hypothetical protein [Clostridium sp.]|uniref:hypothetical protein n=1 Tax=Clostridium sp. TaxID=1506 RepID=UPI001A410926|nr:hypothetical protein [Clostridium sp.]MBK5242761.1 hypothetical protein [Clostridium sp.]